MANTTFVHGSFQAEQQDAYDGIDLDIRVTEHTQPTITGLIQGSDYLTCKTDSTCDGSDAC
ncbi:hypothetical protein [Dictyobacter formicarum]|uniref:FxLD family lantipeptide n=1 Tax=Dictyobacter formicarum TaxID=2778368 RepID=A0ABQ3V8B4_9CHLR|nr:hypothetical protein [Dictyobacter formicarum]GHO82367.1 hypothetical protein KSZ_03730 [Dictyobacter formicarum]